MHLWHGVDNERFYNQLQYAVAEVPATEIPIPVVDWRGHVGANAGVFSDASGGHGLGTRNKEGERVIEFAMAKGLLFDNTWFSRGTRV